MDILRLSTVVESNPTKRGLAILVTNEYDGVAGLQTLAGSLKDGNRMKLVFEQLQIATVWRQNVTVPQLRGLLAEVPTLRVPRSYKSITFYFSGHGFTNDLLCMNDTKTVHLQEIVNAFMADQAPNIGNIPKLFFIDACRGNETFRAVIVPRSGASKVEEAKRQNSSPLALDRGGKEAKTVFVPPKGNMLIAFSNIAMNRALESKDGGIWTKALAKRLAGSKENVGTVLTLVRKDLQHMYQDPMWRDHMQLPETVSRLLEPVYLNPESLQDHSAPLQQVDVSPPGVLTQRDEKHPGYYRGRLLQLKQTKKIDIIKEAYNDGDPFICTLGIFNCSNQKSFEFKSDGCKQKQEAKESAARKAVVFLGMEAKGGIQPGPRIPANASPPQRKVTAPPGPTAMQQLPKKAAISSGASTKDPISKLKEYCDKNRLDQPVYTVVESGNATFKMSVKVTSAGVTVGDMRTTKKDAKASAAQKALAKLRIL